MPKFNKNILNRVEEQIGADAILKKIRAGKKLRIKYGVDPTVSTLHLGHGVVLRMIRKFQDAGHKAVILWGDFTARIGDPSDKLDPRAGLTKKEIEKNIKPYLKELTKILDTSRAKLEVRRNSEWYDKMNLQDFLDIAKNVSAVRIFERDMFQERIKKGKPVWTHEFLYPILQGFDSVMLESDLTIIGSDQKFNELMAREIQKIYNQEPQALLIMPILPGTDGKEKMSQSLGNLIGLSEKPKEQYGKIMSLPDSVLHTYFKLLTDFEEKEIIKKLKNPRDAKMELAREIVAWLHSKKAVATAEKEFVRVFQKKKAPAKMPIFKTRLVSINIVDLLLETGLVTSKSEARRLIKEKGIKINKIAVEDPNQKVFVSKRGFTLQKGKRYFIKVIKR